MTELVKIKTKTETTVTKSVDVKGLMVQDLQIL